ncbi:hypothetical protein K474DRAFT_1773177 [Panus rudis PR-1116 ss-1]|nr:hypothetical protein K474DRAFT_1773177 [Panus rudis PR-1116 ss-1]
MDPSSTQSGPSNKTLNKKRLLQLIVTLGYLNIEVVQATAGKGANSRRPAKNTVDSTRDEVMDAFLDILAALPAVKGDTLAVAVGNWKSGLEEISVYLASNRAVHPRVEGILRDFWVKLQSLHALMLSSQIDHIILEQQRTALLSFVMQTMHAKLKSRVKKYSSLFFEYRYRISPNKSTAYEVSLSRIKPILLQLFKVFKTQFYHRKI